MDRLPDLTVQVGTILFTQRFGECVRFYRDKLGLKVWFEKEGLCCLHFGTGYLMVETGGRASAGRKTAAQNPTVLRFNVPDVSAAAALLRSQGVDVVVRQFDWGQIGAFADPDGNPCELADAGDPEFSQ